jgi:hypothetical protein
MHDVLVHGIHVIGIIVGDIAMCVISRGETIVDWKRRMWVIMRCRGRE